MDPALYPLVGAIVAPILATIGQYILEILRERRASRSSAQEAERIVLPPGVKSSTSQNWLRRYGGTVLIFVLFGAVGGLALRQVTSRPPPPPKPTATLTSIIPSPISTVTATTVVIDPTSTFTPTSTITASPSVTPTATIEQDSVCMADKPSLFEDDFSSNENNWLVGDEFDQPYTIEERAVVDGSYRMSVFFKEEALTTSTIPFINPKDFLLAFNSTIVDRDGTGPARIAVSFRIDSDGNYYSARFGDDGKYSLYLRMDDTFIPLVPWNSSEAFDLSENRPNRFVVKANAWQLTLCVNSIHLVTYIDSRINQAGRIGIGLGGANGVNTIAEFDELIVTRLN